MAKIDDTQIERMVYRCIQESENLKKFSGEMVGVLYDVTRRKGEVFKRLQINDWGGNKRQEVPLHAADVSNRAPHSRSNASPVRSAQTRGLTNTANTCFLNASLQCLGRVWELGCSNASPCVEACGGKRPRCQQLHMTLVSFVNKKRR